MLYSLLFLTAWTAQAALPHHEQLAPGVYAAGFSARYESATCGWVVGADSTVLIDLPHGLDPREFVADVGRLTGKPVRSLLLTHRSAKDTDALRSFQAAGIGLIERPPEGIAAIEYKGGRALYIRAQKVLFTGPAGINGPRVALPGHDSEEWMETLERLRMLGAAKVVPAFGSWGDPSIIERQRKFLREFRRQIGYMISMGRPLAAIEQEVRLPAEFYVWMPYDEPSPEDVRYVYGELTAPSTPYQGRTLSREGTHALVLIGDRFHEPEHVETGLRPVFAATGVTPHFTVDVRALTAANLAQVKLLVILRDGMLWPAGPTGKEQIWMTPEQERDVVGFVQNGGAFLNLHNSMGVYPADGPYLNLVGGRYIGHGPLERFRVEVLDHDHPVTRGVRDFFAADEQHTPPADESKVHLLLRNRDDEGKTAAAGWVYEPGRGRLCHLASGHTREALNHPEYQRLMRNAVSWLLRQ